MGDLSTWDHARSMEKHRAIETAFGEAGDGRGSAVPISSQLRLSQ